MEKGLRSVAGRKEPIAAIRISQISPKETQTFPNRKSCLPCGISAAPPTPVDHTPCFPHLASDPLCADKRTWGELLKAPT